MSIVSATPVLTLEVEVGTPIEPGAVGAGVRRFIPILGGRVTGVLDGVVMPGGGDWQTIHDDGNLHLEAHYALRTTSGAVIEVVSSGVRAAAPAVMKRLAAGEAVDPSAYYFRTAVRMRTGAAELAHLNFKLFVARGERRQGLVRLEVFEVL